MEDLLEYEGYLLSLCLFWGEPLLNPEAFQVLRDFFRVNAVKIKEKDIKFEVKIITNWVLINDKYIQIFQEFQADDNIIFEINLSIDGTRETQISQRGMRNSKFDYYDMLQANIQKLKENDIFFTFGLVMAFERSDFITDILYLWNTYQIPVFIMPVDLDYDYIKNNKNIYSFVDNYLRAIHKTLMYFHHPERRHVILNMQEPDFRDLKMPPIGPTLSHDGEIYITRDYLFTMDGSAGFTPIFHYPKDSIHSIMNYFTWNDIVELEHFWLKSYYGKTLPLNKKIGDYFTKLLYHPRGENM